MFWASARVELRREGVAQHFLELAGFEVYAPRVCEPRIRNGRRLKTLVPLFPSYVFIAIESAWHRARWSIGVAGLLMAGERPAVVADRIIDDIRSRERNGIVELPERQLRPGDRVRILAGPFQGELALYQSMRPRERIEVLLQLLGRQSRIVLRCGDVEPVRT